MSTVPSEFQPLFPSSEIKNLNSIKDKNYIIQTLLKNSTLDGWRWMMKTYSSEDLSTVIKASRILTPKETYYWSYLLNIPKNEILCLNKDLQKVPKTSWVY